MHKKGYVTAAGLLMLSACVKPQAKESQALASVEVTSVTQATIRRIVSGDGVLFPREQASITSKINSPVQKFYVNRGDHVRAGQLLAIIENRDLTAAAAEGRGAAAQADANLRATEGATIPESLAKAQADLDAARDTRESAKRILDNRQQLFRQGALARRQVDESQLAYAQALAQFRSADEHLRTLQSVSSEEQIKAAGAQVQTARAHYDSLEAQVAFSRIVSPVAGIVADRPVNQGEMASPGAPLITIVDISSLVARIDIPGADVGSVKAGQTASITRPGADSITGKVTVVSPTSDANTTTFQVWIQIDNPGNHLKPGSTVHAAVTTEVYKAATVVPVAAILPGEDGGTAVLVVSHDSIVHKRAVKLGVRQGSQQQILSGVSPGEEIVIVGGIGLDDNTKVRVISTAVEESGDDEKDTGK